MWKLELAGEENQIDGGGFQEAKYQEKGGRTQGYGDPNTKVSRVKWAGGRGFEPRSGPAGT